MAVPVERTTDGDMAAMDGDNEPRETTGDKGTLEDEDGGPDVCTESDVRTVKGSVLTGCGVIDVFFFAKRSSNLVALSENGIPFKLVNINVKKIRGNNKKLKGK